VTGAVRILGIDPGSLATGFGMIEVDGAMTRPIAWGVIRAAGEHSDRLRKIFAEMAVIIAEHRPDEIAVERVFVHRNADSALKLGQARAAALCASFDRDLPIHEYAPREVKKAIAGSGAADKEQVGTMIRMLLGLREELEADASDALAIAICHSQMRSLHGLMLEAVSA
jgi:crossover junction endodeoxyribonuclease RuvC